MSKSVQSVPDGYFLNPIIRGNYADPSVVRVEDDYYMVHTSCKYVPGLIVWHSRNLVDWRPIGNALSDYTGDVWAPEFIYYEGLYYIYFPSNRTNWVITAASPEGPWSEPIDLQAKLIDPGHVVGPDGKRYLYLSNGYIIQLADDGLSVVGEARKVYDGWEYPKDWIVEGFALESPKAMFHNGYYYLTVAQGGTSGPPTGHMVASSRSKTPWGPWEHSPHNPIVRTRSNEEQWWSQGHATVIDSPDGQWWMVYHAYENGMHTLGRHTLLLPIEWTEDGWFKVQAGADPALPLKKPAGESLSPGWPLLDTFKDEKLGLHWQRFGTADARRYQLEDGVLKIPGSGEAEACSPLLYMVADRSYEMDVKLTIEGDVEARLALFHDEGHYFGISYSNKGVGLFRTYKKYEAMPVEGRTVHLRIRNDEHLVSFYYSLDGEAWEAYDKTIEASGFHHNTLGGYLSLRGGLDAVGQGTARFESFEYRPLRREV